LKSEPEEFSIDDLKHDKKTSWTGVRNFAARKNIRAMQKGDVALFYHSGKEPAVVGEGKVVSLAYPDEDVWSTIDIAFSRKFPREVTREELLAHSAFKNSILARQGRLSVQPVTPTELKTIYKLAGL
jgi:predicted RNA-binding protein with PUA-like domain